MLMMIYIWTIMLMMTPPCLEAYPSSSLLLLHSLCSSLAHCKRTTITSSSSSLPPLHHHHHHRHHRHRHHHHHYMIHKPSLFTISQSSISSWSPTYKHCRAPSVVGDCRKHRQRSPASGLNFVAEAPEPWLRTNSCKRGLTLWPFQLEYMMTIQSKLPPNLLNVLIAIVFLIRVTIGWDQPRMLETSRGGIFILESFGIHRCHAVCGIKAVHRL